MDINTVRPTNNSHNRYKKVKTTFCTFGDYNCIESILTYSVNMSVILTYSVNMSVILL